MRRRQRRGRAAVLRVVSARRIVLPRVTRLSGKIAVVSGGARGIGRAIVEKFAAEGATVTFVDVDDAVGRATERECVAAGLAATFRRADITSEADVRGAIEDVVARHGTVDVLVNNAGINAYFDATEMTEAEWDR